MKLSIYRRLYNQGYSIKKIKTGHLQGADLRGADLRGADLREADLREANLWGANLCGADLWEADLQGANLQGADLQGANLQGADLQGANLQGADLRGVDLKIIIINKFVYQIIIIGQYMQIGCETKKILEWYRMPERELQKIDNRAVEIKKRLKPKLMKIIRIVNRLGNKK